MNRMARRRVRRRRRRRRSCSAFRRRTADFLNRRRRRSSTDLLSASLCDGDSVSGPYSQALEKKKQQQLHSEL
ncbi:uncharacterized protein DS421_17g584780 [Arachis hypogaea]|nr:uncharacterized protein DS421_17g584780 [Arachis hypogaea]